MSVPLPLWRTLCVVLLAIITLAGCERPPAIALDQQVYIWQRQWRASHAQALAQSHADFSTLRILAAQLHPREGWIQARIDPQLLKQDGRPLVAVIRLDGQLPRLDSAAIAAQMQTLISTWQAMGLNLRGVEIDHDCASNRLSEYAALLHTLRSQIPHDVTLSITALPAWLSSPALTAVLGQVDSSVLQVHAVRRPSLGLFEPEQALRWAVAYGALSPKPFLLALPAYGVALTDNGEVESEAPLTQGGTRRELQADPQQVAALLKQLQSTPINHLTGLIWFRLPLADDRRAWPLATLQAVLHQQPLRGDVQVVVLEQGSLYEVRVTNRGNASAPLPAELTTLAQGCEAGDGARNYRLQRPLDNPRFVRQQPAQLAAGQTRVVGWVRCHHLDQGGFRVTP